MASQRRSVTAPPGLAPATRAAAAAKTVPAAGASTVAATVGHDPRLSLVDARTALAAGRYDDAATMAMAAADAPRSADAHHVCGLALVNLGRDREALVALRKAVYVEPSAGLPQFVLAGVLVRLGEFTAAARCYCSAADALAAGGVAGEDAELGGRTAAELAILCRSLGARAASSGLAAGAEQPRHPPTVLRCPPRRRSGPK
jgi:Flp pilus assembly protein TadD